MAKSHKMVNGEKVDLTDEEFNLIQEEWKANAAQQAKEDAVAYLKKRAMEVCMKSGEIMQLLFEDIEAGTELKSGKFYAAIAEINAKHSK